MFRQGKGMIVLALGVALLAGAMLYSLSHETPLTPPIPEEQVMQGFWADDLRDCYGLGPWEGAVLGDGGFSQGQMLQGFRAHDLCDYYGLDFWDGATPGNEGLRLSQLQPIHTLDSGYYSFNNLVTGSGANIYGDANGRYDEGDSLFVYNVDQGIYENLPLPFSAEFIHDLTVAPGDRLYGAARVSAKDTRLFTYDPGTNIVRDLSALLPFADIWSISDLTVAPDGRLYGVVQVGKDRARLFTYHPGTNAARDLGTLMPFSQVQRISRLTIASDGRLYGEAQVGEWDTRFFVCDLLANEVRDLSAFVDSQRIWHLVAGADSLVYGYTNKMIFSFNPLLNRATLIDIPLPMGRWNYADEQLVLGNDGVLYGVVRDDESQVVFALNIASGAVITQALSGRINVLRSRPNAGVYLGTEQGLWALDLTGAVRVDPPLPLGATALNVDQLIVRDDGRLYGCGRYYSCRPGTWCLPKEYFLFTYAPSSGEFKKLEHVGCAYEPLVIGADGRLYDTIFQAGENHLVGLDLDTYTREGVAQSDLVEPLSLVLTRVVVGGLDDEVRALVCGRDGNIYGVTSASGYSANELDWLFKYDPRELEPTVERITPDVPVRQGGTTLVQLDDGRLVGGTRGGRIFVYDPTTGETWDVGKPNPDTVEIAALALGRDGLVYGGTLAYGSSADTRATLFTFDPVSGLINDVGRALPQARLVGAVAVAEDGLVYAGVDDTLAVYDPDTERVLTLGVMLEAEERVCSIRALVAGPRGRIYGGCDDHFFVYDPSSQELTDLGIPVTDVTWGRYGDVVALTVGDDGRIYGSLEFKYADSKLFVYDPALEQMTNLGVAVPKQVLALAACDDGNIYAGIGLNNSYYRGPAYLFAFRTDCPSGPLGAWERLSWQAETPPGTRVTVDVLNQEGELLLAAAPSGASLRSIDPISNTAIMLRATLSTQDPSVTPLLKNWRVDYAFSCLGVTTQ